MLLLHERARSDIVSLLTLEVLYGIPNLMRPFHLWRFKVIVLTYIHWYLVGLNGYFPRAQKPKVHAGVIRLLFSIGPYI
jgi:hypothetical protein